MKFAVHKYTSGRKHRLIYTPDIPGVTDVVCRVYPPGGTMATSYQLDPIDAVFEFEYQFKQLGDYLLVLEVDGVAMNVLKAVVPT